MPRPRLGTVMAVVPLWYTVAAGGLLAPYAAAADQLRTIDHVALLLDSGVLCSRIVREAELIFEAVEK